MILSRFVVALFVYVAFMAGAASAQPRPPAVGGISAPGTPGDTYWQSFVDELAAESDGRLAVQLLIRGELGPEEALLQALRRGRIHFIGASTSGLSLIVPELAVLRLPFLFGSTEEMDFVLNGPVRDMVADLLRDKDLIMLDWMSAGWLNIYATQKIAKLEDFTGKRLRISVDTNARLFMEAMGADTAQIPFSDVLPGLQTNLIDGGEQSTQLFIIGGLARYAPHLTLSRHGYMLSIVVTDRRWFETQSTEDQALYTGAVPSDQWYRDLFETENESSLAEAATKDGLTLYSIEGTTRATWKERTAGVATQVIADTGGRSQELYDLIMDGKAAFAAQEQ